MRLEKGQRITIHDDQFSPRRREKKARLIKRLIKHSNEEYWHVRFIEEDYSSYRWISTLAKREKTEELGLHL